MKTEIKIEEPTKQKQREQRQKKKKKDQGERRNPEERRDDRDSQKSNMQATERVMQFSPVSFSTNHNI
jgi:hypothetical protein